MSSRPAIVSCVDMLAVEGRTAALEGHLAGVVGRAVEGTPGLVSREVYRVASGEGRFLVVHAWRSRADLERFRAYDGPAHDVHLVGLAASVEPYTAQIAAQFSRLDADHPEH
jgi:heme-degrading monooxygenase HmoA